MCSKEIRGGIAESDARAKAAEGQVASAHAAASEASAKAEGFRLNIAKATERAANADLARVRLEAQIADRPFDAAQQRVLADRIRTLHGLSNRYC